MKINPLIKMWPTLAFVLWNMLNRKPDPLKLKLSADTYGDDIREEGLDYLKAGSDSIERIWRKRSKEW